jgi:hypothetical protein
METIQRQEEEQVCYLTYLFFGSKHAILVIFTMFWLYLLIAYFPVLLSNNLKLIGKSGPWKHELNITKFDVFVLFLHSDVDDTSIFVLLWNYKVICNIPSWSLLGLSYTFSQSSRSPLQWSKHDLLDTSENQNMHIEKEEKKVCDSIQHIWEKKHNLRRPYIHSLPLNAYTVTERLT